MKPLFTFIFSLCAVMSIAQTQYFQFSNSAINNRTEYYFTNSPTTADGNRLAFGWIKGTYPRNGDLQFTMNTDVVRFGMFTGSDPAIVGFNNDGSIYRLKKWDFIDTNFVVTRNYLRLSLLGYVTPSQLTWSNISGKPTAFTPTMHTHSITDIIGLQTAIDLKLQISDTGNMLAPYFRKPAFGSDKYLNGNGLAVVFPSLFSGNYNDLTNKPVIFSGNYNDLTNRPALFSGNYLDLTNKPVVFSGAYADLTGKPLLFSGSYNDLTNRPTLFSGSYSDLINKPLTFAPSAHTHTISEIVNLQFTLDQKLSSEVDGSTTNEIELPTQSGQAGKVLGTNGTNTVWQNASTGTVTSVGVTSSTLTVTNTPVTTNGNITVNLPATGVVSGSYGITVVDQYGRVTSGRRQETYSGSSNASGNYTVTFGTPYAIAPNIQCQVIGGSTETFFRVTSITTTGFTVNAFTRGIVSSLPIVGALTSALLGSTTTPLSSAAIDVLITEK